MPDGEELVLVALLAVALRRNRSRRIVLHHHSRRYLDRPSQILRIIYKLLGHSQVVNVSQCQRLAVILQSVYGTAQGVAASNASVVNPGAVERRPIGSPLHVGFFGRKSKEKGLQTALSLFERVLADYPDSTVSIFGESGTQPLDSELDQLRARFGSRVHIGGPLFGIDKFNYLASLDVLLFPTTYASETEGIVALEALAVGTSVIASDLGCLPTILETTAGDALPISEVRNLRASSIAQLAATPETIAMNRTRFVELQAESSSELRAVGQWLIHDTPDLPD